MNKQLVHANIDAADSAPELTNQTSSLWDLKKHQTRRWTP